MDAAIVKRYEQSIPSFSAEETARFWSKVDTSGECWLWTASTGGSGYGQFSLTHDRKHTMIPSHRYAYIQLVGPIAPGLYACHRCDTPICVRPEHLFLGTQLENLQDMKVKGRSAAGDRHGTKTHPETVMRGEAKSAFLRVHAARGETHVCAKLTEQQVREILRRQEEPRISLAEEFGVTPSQIGHIVRRKNWAHVNV